MSEAAPISMARSATREREEIAPPDDVTFPELVWAHHLRERELRHEAGSDFYDGPVDQRYRAFREQFEQLHGRIIDEFWCKEEAAAVVVTRTVAAIPLRWLGKDPILRIYCTMNWQTREQPPEVAKLMHEGEALAMRAREVLRSTSQRLVVKRLFSVAAYMLGYFDGRKPSDAESEEAIAEAREEIAEIHREYVTAATRTAQIVYFWGMLIGLLWLTVLGLIALPFLRDLPHLGSTSRENFYGAALVGALGAMVSVVARMNSNSFSVEYDVGRPTLRRLGAFRPLVGAIFGAVIYFVLASGLMYGDRQSDKRSFAFYAVFSFLAGFSERFVKDTLDHVEGGSSAPPPPPESAEETPPA
jgi:hypothetical protein